MSDYDQQYSPAAIFFDKLLTFLGEYFVWILLVGIIILQIYVPLDFEEIVKALIFWAPVTIFGLGLLLILTKNTFRFRRERERGQTQYEIIVPHVDIYTIDLIIYLGTIAILAVPYFLDYLGGLDVLDLIQALVFFSLANLVKKVLLKQIIK